MHLCPIADCHGQFRAEHGTSSKSRKFNNTFFIFTLTSITGSTQRLHKYRAPKLTPEPLNQKISTPSPPSAVNSRRKYHSPNGKLGKQNLPIAQRSRAINPHQTHRPSNSQFQKHKSPIVQTHLPPFPIAKGPKTSIWKLLNPRKNV